MLLEEELVNNILKEGKTEKDVLETCKDLTAKGILNLNPKKVETALRRYSLLKKYNSQNNSKRAIEKRREYLFERMTNSTIEEFKEANSSVVQAKLYTQFNEFRKCDICGTKEEYECKIGYERIVKKEGVLIKIRNKTHTVFDYCYNCGNITNQDANEMILH
jgi:hypothetical protein